MKVSSCSYMHNRYFACRRLALEDAHRLQTLEEAVEYEVPDDFALINRRHIPDEKVGHDCKWSGQNNPAKK